MDREDRFLNNETELYFPSSLRVAIALRNAFEEVDLHLREAERLISTEPVLTTGLIRAAGSSVYGRPMAHPSIHVAIEILGFAAVRTIAISIAMKQLRQGARSEAAKIAAEALWLHSLEIACLAEARALATSHYAPEKIFLMGLVHEIQGFVYLAKLGESSPMWTPQSADPSPVGVGSYPSRHQILTALGVGELAEGTEADERILNEAHGQVNTPSPFEATPAPREAGVGDEPWVIAAYRKLDSLTSLF